MKTLIRAKFFPKLHPREAVLNPYEQLLSVNSPLLNHFRAYGAVAAALSRRAEFCIAREAGRSEEKVAESIPPIGFRLDGKKCMSTSTKGASGGHKKPGLTNNSTPDCPPETELPHYQRFRSFNSEEEAKKNISSSNAASRTAAPSNLSGDCEKEAKPPLSSATCSSGPKPVLSESTCSRNSKPVISASMDSTNSQPESKSREGVKKSSSSDSERSMYQEKQHSYKVDFSKVTSAPSPSRQQWWYPDPYTGYYTPEDHFGETSPVPPEEKPMKKKNAFVNLSYKKGHGKKGALWMSMEDLPDSLS